MIEKKVPDLRIPPLLFAAGFFAAGIALGRYGPGLIFPRAWFLAALALFLFAHRPGSRFPGWLKPAATGLLFLLAGLLRLLSVTPFTVPESLAPFLDSDREAVISGQLLEAPAFDGSTSKILLAADQLWQRDGHIAEVDIPVLLRMPFAVPASMAPGDRLLLKAALHRPSPPGNPGAFDYRQYLADQSINLTGFIRSPACLSEFIEPGADAGFVRDLRISSQIWRQQINNFIAGSGLPDRDIGLYQALLTGSRDLVPRQIMTDFKNSGAYHMLAISGMHLGLLALLSGFFINLLLRRSTTLLNNISCRKATALLVLAVLCLYALLAGMKPPVARALIMAATFIFALLLDRPATPSNSLGLAALITLSWQPAAIFQASFQLSYMAVGAIISLSRAFPGMLAANHTKGGARQRLRQWLTSGLIVSLAALIATAPLTAFHFHQLSPSGPLSTMLIAPILCFWALPLGLIGIMLASFLPAVAKIIILIGATGLDAAQYLAALISSLPWSSWQPSPPAFPAIALYYLMLGVLLFGQSPRRLRPVAVPFLLAAICLVSFLPASSSSGSDTLVTFLDVGQGSSTLLEFSSGEAILVDGGATTTGDFDPGEQLIAPFLNHRGIKRLDAVVITHDHADHYNGLPYIIKHFKPRTLWLNDTDRLSADLEKIVSQASGNDIQVNVPKQGEILLGSGTEKLTCLSAFHLHGNTDYSENSRSLVLELRSGDNRIIMPGDIMAGEGESLSRQGLIRKCSVLLAPHHGSDNSAGLALAESSRPEWIVVSAGDSEGGHFPGADLLDWCQTNRTRVHRTGREGAIAFHLGPTQAAWQKLSDKSGTGQRSGRILSREDLTPR